MVWITICIIILFGVLWNLYHIRGNWILVNKVSSIIEINGNRYDAVTGQLIGAAKAAAQHIKKPINGLSIDGFSKPARAIRKSAKERSVQAAGRKPQRAKTLMRSIVKKSARTQPEDKIKSRSLSPDHARVSRAASIGQDGRVKRFGVLPFAKKSSQVAKSGEIMAKHAASPTRPSATLAVALPSVMGSAAHHRLERLLDYALTHADAHKKSLERSNQARRKIFGKVPRWLAITIVGIVAATAIGIFIWQKMPAASLKLAATKARVDASLPTPISGYKIGSITASQNAVITTMQSTSDSSKKYTVTEKASTQPTESLAAATSASGSGQQVQTVQDQGRTYILAQDKDKSTAACTNGHNTTIIEGPLNPAELSEAAKNACKSQ